MNAGAGSWLLDVMSAGDHSCYFAAMAKPYRSRIDSRNHHHAANAAGRDRPERGALAKVLANAKDTAKAMLGF